LVRATANRLQTGMARRVSGYTLSTVRGIERRIWESPSLMAREDVNICDLRVGNQCRPFQHPEQSPNKMYGNLPVSSEYSRIVSPEYSRIVNF
jgi:hypothetical protein